MAAFEPIFVATIVDEDSPSDSVVFGQIISSDPGEATLRERGPNMRAGIPAEATHTCFSPAVRSPRDLFLYPVVRTMLGSCGGVEMDEEEAGVLLFSAASESSTNCVAAMKEAVQRGASPNAGMSGITALFFVVGRGNSAEAIECLLFLGANADKLSKTRTMHMTPLMMCAYCLGTYRIEVAAALLRHGANPNAVTTGATNSMCHLRFKGLTPLIFATLAGDIMMVRLLLRHGAVADIQTPDGITALLCAVVLHSKQSHPSDATIYLDIARALLEHGADPYKPYAVTVSIRGGGVQIIAGVCRIITKTRDVKLSLTPYGIAVGLQGVLENSFMKQLLFVRSCDNHWEHSQLHENNLAVDGRTSQQIRFLYEFTDDTYQYNGSLKHTLLQKADLSAVIPPAMHFVESLLSY